MPYMKTLTIGGTTFDVRDDKAVRFTEQTLTDEQKARARSNIGAAAQNGDGGLNTTAKNLLIEILQSAVFTTNVTGKIAALEAALAGGGNSGGTDAPDLPVGPDLPVPDVIVIEDGVMTIDSVGSKITVSDGVMTIA